MATGYRPGGSHGRAGSNGGGRGGLRLVSFSEDNDVETMSEDLADNDAYRSVAGATSDGPAVWTDVDLIEV